MGKAKTRLHQKRWAIRLFEWGVLASIILVLMGVFLRRVRHLQGEAERLTVQATIDNMQAAVLLTTVLANGQQLHTEARAGGNPVALLKAQSGLEPVDYLGEFSHKRLDEVAPGQWRTHETRTTGPATGHGPRGGSQ